MHASGHAADGTDPEVLMRLTNNQVPRLARLGYRIYKSAEATQYVECLMR